jgi:hypothetical protein
MREVFCHGASRRVKSSLVRIAILAVTKANAPIADD